jgi:hypothetical protein
VFGSPDPALAVSTSIRGSFFEEWIELGFEAASDLLDNGLYVSSSAIDALRCRYLFTCDLSSDNMNATATGYDISGGLLAIDNSRSSIGAYGSADNSEGNKDGIQFFNDRTNMSPYRKPELVIDEEKDGELEEDEVEPSVPKGKWCEVVDPSSGNPYYFHTITKETVWEKPTDFDLQEEEKEEEKQGGKEDEEKAVDVGEEGKDGEMEDPDEGGGINRVGSHENDALLSMALGGQSDTPPPYARVGHENATQYHSTTVVILNTSFLFSRIFSILLSPLTVLLYYCTTIALYSAT